MTLEEIAKLQFGSKFALLSTDSNFRDVSMQYNGILPIHKAAHCTSFHLVALLRKRTGIKKIGHSGTLDPFATGVMVMLIGREYTRLSNQLLSMDKEYRATIELGKTTDSYDIDGQILSESSYVPSFSEIEAALLSFQGDCFQTPPMFSAKKKDGQKLYHLARQGITVERTPVHVRIHTTLIRYEYPLLELDIFCSKGTYIRSIAHDLGKIVQSGAFLRSLSRTRSGNYHLSDCVPQEKIQDPSFDLTPYLRKSV